MFHLHYRHWDGGIFYISVCGHHHMTDCNLTNLTILPMMDKPEVGKIGHLSVWHDRLRRLLIRRNLFGFFSFDEVLDESLNSNDNVEL